MTSVACAPEAPESAESIAGEPSCGRRSKPAGLTKRGSACRPCCSCPVADCIADSDEYEDPKTYIVPGTVRYTRLALTVVLPGAESQIPMLPARRLQVLLPYAPIGVGLTRKTALSTEMLFSTR